MPQSSFREDKFPREDEIIIKDDETSNSPTIISDPEISTEKSAAADYESELTLQSSLQVLGGFMILFNTYNKHCMEFNCRWGYLNAFGVFQNYYKNVLIPQSSNSQISWIGSTQGN
jgi:hypothetical protein